ncbi:MAG: PEP-CTERM sorting domain-containing protein [Prosthecobacter sp.]
MLSRCSLFRVLACLLALGLAAMPAHAFLGSFEEEDGYRIPLTGQIPTAMLGTDAQFYLMNNAGNGYTGVVPLGAYPITMGDGDGGWHGPDVTRYNAGGYGTTNGGPGGSAMDIADNTGMWQALAGGRLNEDQDAPYYYGGQLFRDQIVAYHFLYPRTGSQVLSVMAADENLSYSYTLDSRDLGGLNPASTGAALVQMSFWARPTDWDNEDTGNIMGLSLYDSMNQSIFEVGYTGDNRLQYRLAGGGSWITTAHELGSNGWSQIVVSVDTAANTASLAVRAYSDTLSALASTTSSVLNQAAMGVDADSLHALKWDVRGGALDNGAVSYVHFFDDFSFAVSPGSPVPEPGSMLLLGVALGLGTWSRRRV